MENLEEGPIIDDTQLWQNVKKLYLQQSIYN